MDETTRQVVFWILGVGAMLVGAAMVAMLAVIGFFLKTFYDEYKSDKKAAVEKDAKVDDRMAKLAEGFAKRFEELMDKLNTKFDNLPKGSDNLTQVMMENEKSTQKRLDEHSQRIQDNVREIKDVRNHWHNFTGAGGLTGDDLDTQIKKRRLARKYLGTKEHPNGVPDNVKNYEPEFPESNDPAPLDP